MLITVESTFIKTLNKHAPMKGKYIRANSTPYMNKLITKAIMNRSRLKNNYIKKTNKLKKQIMKTKQDIRSNVNFVLT